MLDYMMEHTDLVGYLSVKELCIMRLVSSSLKDKVEMRRHPHTGYTWIQKCRLLDPKTLWNVENKLASCHEPVFRDWLVAYWTDRLPPVVPSAFWNFFLRIIRGFLSMSCFMRWCPSFQQQPLVLPSGQERWDIVMRLEIVGGYVHDEQEDYPEVLQDMDEFISLGIIKDCPHDILRNSILGLNGSSIGWHSDDGNFYFDSLMVGEGEKFGSGDTVEVILDYSYGVVLFKKNGRLIYIYELIGSFLSTPLIFAVSGTSMNNLYFSII